MEEFLGEGLDGPNQLESPCENRSLAQRLIRPFAPGKLHGPSENRTDLPDDQRASRGD
jgi:hypothetical protein